MRKTKVLALAASLAAFALSGCSLWPSGASEKVAWEVTADSGAALSGAQSSASGSVETAPQASVAYVSQAAGTVTKRPANGRARPVVAGSTALAAGEILSTGADGSASITFADGTTVRLAADSRISFSAIAADSADATLESGSLWARVLKPLGDGTLYTFRTADLSAGVRGTAVFLEASASGSEIEVHDSYSDQPQDEGVTVTLPDSGTGAPLRLAARRKLFVDRVPAPKSASGAALTGSAAPAASGALASTGAQVPPRAPRFREEPLDKAAALADDFKRDSTQKDLVMMSRMVKERPLDAPHRRKIEGELATSMPSDAREVLALVQEKRLLEDASGTGAAPSVAAAKSGTGAPSEEERARRFAKDPEAMLARVEKDMAIRDLRERFNRDARERMKDKAAGRNENVVEDKRALDEAVEKIVDPNFRPEDLRRAMPENLPPLPGEVSAPDRKTLREAVKELVAPRKPLPTSPEFRLPEPRPQEGSGATGAVARPEGATGAVLPRRPALPPVGEILKDPDAKLPLRPLLPRDPAGAASGEARPVSGEPLPAVR